MSCGSSSSTADPELDDTYTSPGYFPFPFPPYDIQEEFMKKLYQTLEQGKVGIFESPTGTGKSLSLICGALTWLRDFERQQQEMAKKLLSRDKSAAEVDKTTDSKESQTKHSEPSWVEEYVEKKAQQEILDKFNTKMQQQEKHKAKLEGIKKSKSGFGTATQKRKREDSHSDNKDILSNSNGTEMDEKERDDEEFVLAEYNSDFEKGNSDDSSSESEDEEEEHITKIYYCSRTHSQLSQFVSEVKKSPFGADAKLVSLGSRQNFCINSEVQKLKSVNRINERCLELQRNKKEKKTVMDDGKRKRRKKEECGCQFYDYKRFRDFRDYIFVSIQDIEQLVDLGKTLKACPYYGSRLGIANAQVVALPYNTLLHKSTREAVGIKLKDNIIIVDEAHNLIETINNVHSTEISGLQILSSRKQLSQYLDKYRSRLKAKNLMYINQLLFLLNGFLEFLGGKVLSTKAETEQLGKDEKTTNTNVSLQTINDFVFSSKIDNVNLFKVRRYCERSMISRKLNGFVDKCSQQTGTVSSFTEDANDTNKASQLMYIEAFLDALTNANEDGRVLISKSGLLSKCSLKFLLLNPAVHFADVVKESRAVIVAGGTMQPALGSIICKRATVTHRMSTFSNTNSRKSFALKIDHE